MAFIVAVPLDAAPVTVKLGFVKPSAVSVAVNVPVMSPSSTTVPVKSPPNVAASFSAVIVTSIS